MVELCATDLTSAQPPETDLQRLSAVLLDAAAVCQQLMTLHHDRAIN